MCKQYRKIFNNKKIGKHLPCGYSVSTIWEFNNIENKHTLYCAENCTKKFFKSLKEHAKNVNEFEKKKNVTTNKKRTKITSRCKSILHLQKEIHKTQKGAFFVLIEKEIRKVNKHGNEDIITMYYKIKCTDGKFIIKSG